MIYDVEIHISVEADSPELAVHKVDNEVLEALDANDPGWYGGYSVGEVVDVTTAPDSIR